MAEDSGLEAQEVDVPDPTEDQELQRWYEMLESGATSFEKDENKEESYSDYINSRHPSAYLVDQTDGSDKIGESDLPYNPEFYDEPEDVRLQIFASDVSSLRDKNQKLSKQLESIKNENLKYKEKSQRKGVQIDMLYKERNDAMGETYHLKSQIKRLQEQLEEVKADLENERQLRQKSLEGKSDANLEKTLVDVKFKLAKHQEKNDELEDEKATLLQENTRLRDRTKTQEEQLHQLSQIFGRVGVKLSSLKMKQADVKSGHAYHLC